MRNAFCQTKLFDSSNAVAAANNAHCTALSNCLGNCFRTLAEGIHFEHAHRSVPNNHFCLSKCFSISLARFAADIKRHILLIQMLNAFSYMRSIRSKGSSHYEVGRQQQLNLVFLSLSQKLLRQLQLILFYKGFAHLVALSSEEGVSHTATNQQRINLIQQVADNADFVAYLCAADNSNEGMQRIGYSLTNILNFFFQQEACSSRQEVRYALYGSMGTVRNTEAVVNIKVCQRSKLLCKLHVVLFFFLMEAQVFQKQNMTSLQLAGSSLSSLAYAVRSKKNLFAQQLAQMLSYRSQRKLRLNLSLRTAQMSHQDNSSLLLQQILNCRQRCGDTGIIGNLALIIQRNVKIYTYQNLFAGNV